MPSQLSKKVDKVSMPVGVESHGSVQHDVYLANLAYVAVWDLMLQDGESKWLWRNVSRCETMMLWRSRVASNSARSRLALRG